ncbi:MAG: DNA repair protein RecO [Clostridia bacterium]|nr:DNA repair protein RecO [Clostridia bacterium]
MLGIVEATGIVTREIKYGDSSRILTLVTKEYGKISVLAGGVRSNKSGMLTSTQLFSYGEFTLFKSGGKSLYKINNCSVIDSFSKLRNSLERMAYASYFCEVTNNIIQEEAPDSEQLNLLLNSLYMLSSDNHSSKHIKAVFEFRTLSIQGFLSPPTKCIHCGSTDNLKYFHSGDGYGVCSVCAEKNPIGLTKVGGAILDAISYIALADNKKTFSFILSPEYTAYLNQLGEFCMEIHLEKHLKTLDYLKKVMALEE